jgi:hypothetical protein
VKLENLMATASTKVRITWNGQGGELDAVTVIDDGEKSVSQALIKMVSGQVVAAGDSFVVEEVKR